MRWVFILLLSSAFSLVGAITKAQDYQELFKGFNSAGLTYTERRYLQAALAFEGHYVGLLDGDWGRLSREAMERYSYKEFGRASEEWHTAVLALSFFDRYERDGWDMRYFPALGMSVMMPLKTLVTDPPSDHFVNYRHSGSSLSVSIGRHDNATATNMHRFTIDAHTRREKPYSVRKTNFAVSSAVLSDGSTLYTRSNFINGAWSTIMVSASARDLNALQAVTSSIAKGQSRALDITVDGKLIEVLRRTMALANSTEQNEANAPAQPSAPLPKRGGYTGTGFVVSADGYVLTNAHVVENCGAILVDGVKAELIDASEPFDLALLKTNLPHGKGVAVFSATPAKLNSDVTVIGYPYAGLLGGLNVTRGAVSSLKGLGGDGNTLQITAPVQSGNSGGPLLASDGEVIGVVVAKLDAAIVEENLGDVPQNVNFAIRGGIAKMFLAQNQVEPELSLEDKRVTPEELAETAASFTSFIECK
ncbi:serine protease [Sedimentitalea sp. CY04]|uniref:Serine protease n=2 Tax=Parasedimentitalea denitrificans TaxID=2211118 RepID=A0ABX0W987_9RHOB|nr:serine protease [Sedimentitalea sp. CY04]